MAPKIPMRKVRKNGKTQWLVDLRKINRGRKFFDTKADAERAVEDIETEFDNLHASALEISASDAAEFIGLKKRLEGRGTIAQAVDYFLTHFRDRPVVTVGEAVETCLKAKKESGKRKRSVQQLGYTLKTLTRAFGRQEIAQITHHEIETWLANPDWKSLETRKRKLIDAGTLFSFAIKRGWLDTSPTAKCERILTEHAPPGILTVERCAALMDAAHRHAPWMLAYYSLALFCGLRPAEIQALTWADVQIEKRFVNVHAAKAKTRQRRIVTIRENCAAWLALGGDIPAENLFVESPRVRLLAGITHWPHDVLRHSFVSYSMPIYGAVETANQAGHSEKILHRHYRELVTREDAEKFWKIMPATGVPIIPRPPRPKHDPEFYAKMGRAGAAKRWGK